LFGREVVVFRFVCVPDFRPASCGVFFHIKKYSRLVVRVKRFYPSYFSRTDSAVSQSEEIPS
jgi:hypothetical protein